MARSHARYYTGGGLRGLGHAQPQSRPLAQVPMTQPLPAGLGAGIMVFQLISLAAVGTLAYHGFKRNRGSVGWALVWGLLGGLVWPVTLPIAYLQGFGKSGVRSNRRRSRRSRRRRNG